ncbi:dihydrolipoyllysine-residue succinyltransferase component of 2-oxoglutarate dehydrogenase complex [Planctomycetota bacterium]|nr:dihydrolipoyllysine-residue succinyltransferase component of 2-oxoglutarate dehydrogenase complex [Planctomycetota bacterium]
MPHLVTVPALGESITEGTIARLLVADGATVTDSTPLFELETDKITTEVQAGAAGAVRFLVKVGDVVAVGGSVAQIEVGAGAAPAPAAKAPAAKVEPAAKAEPTAKAAEPAKALTARHLSPAVKQLVADQQLDPATIAGTGKDGRIIKGDVLAKAATPPAPAAPLAPAASSAPATPGPSAAGTNRRRMTPLRQRIAQRLVQAQRTAAILTTFNEIDCSAAMALRKKWKETFEKEHGVGLGFMSIFAAAAIRALQKYPGINSQIDGDEIVSFDHVNLGIAVGTEKGLVVPVIRQAQRLSFSQTELAIKDFAGKARSGKLTLDDISGGTFTITNGGTYGSLLSTPIINPPQSGILGMHTIKERPVAVDGQVVIRPMMYVALSYDHRIVDGAEAVGFLVRIKELVEAPERLMLGL